ncbi:hypothetical protein HOP50_06g42280 [Chloropicon primus]|uniref:tRNA/rRNA methyltransferase SpoU type domain-containing protein n=2 Tax=Chloropicon primus TaxID=1764295 RepID=A0A5B8MQ03_9CHLO|nr:hypothetical protein A3770_06p42030 [Chloropicon primus]UPR00907.1 hypothetical protein HOP50_06g42280 [Chloropicon primus]|eukprot:QDZ21685.1 hypothetical protein A3770_06p42030 [Chloropicon primus]
MDAPGIPLRKLKRCEAVLQRRLKDVVVVLGRSSTARHYEAVCRTCECLGVQNVWILEHPPPRKLEECPTREAAEQLEESFQLPNAGSGIFKKARKFLSVRRFKRTRDLMDACKEEGLDVWCVHGLAREEYSFDFAEAYGCEDLFEGHGGGESSRSLRRLQGMAPRDVPKRVALVFCTDENGFSRELMEGCAEHVTYETKAGTSLHISVSSALVIHRVIHLKRQKGPGVLQRVLGWVAGGAHGGDRGEYRYTYAFSERDWEEMHKGDLDEGTKLELRRKWFKLLAKTEVRNEEYCKYLKNPVKPFGDLRHPNQFREARIPPKMQKRLAAREEKAGFT